MVECSTAAVVEEVCGNIGDKVKGERSRWELLVISDKELDHVQRRCLSRGVGACLRNT